MRLVIGLGNPGKKYQNNRHNVGQMVIDELKKKKLPKDVVVKKTSVFMNDSGSFIKHLISQYPKISMSSLYIVHDDLDLRLGEYKIQKGKGPREHKGLLSIYNVLGTKDFWYVRVGVDNRLPDNRIEGETYVLQDFSQEELKKLGATIDRLGEDLYDKLKHGQRD